MIEFIVNINYDHEDRETIDELELLLDKQFEYFIDGLMQDFRNEYCSSFDECNMRND